MMVGVVLVVICSWLVATTAFWAVIRRYDSVTGRLQVTSKMARSPLPLVIYWNLWPLFALALAVTTWRNRDRPVR